MTKGQVINLEEARIALADDWNQRNPQTAEEIASFYQSTPFYKADLDAWHSDSTRQGWSTIICAAAKASNAKHILDIGAGAGHDINALWTDDTNRIIHAVEPNKILQHHLIDNSHAIVIMDSCDDLTDEQYTMIICIDVLEHLPDPDNQVLAYVAKHLSMGGIFVEATATHDVETPLHLASLRGWSPGRFLDQHGFVLQEEIGRLRIWRRTTISRGEEPNLLLCAYRGLSAETSLSVHKLVEQGWRQSLHRGDALVSRVRSIAVSKWLQEDAGDVFLMVDDDIVFSPADANKVIELARKTKGIASAAYPVRGGSHLASRTFKTTELIFGPKAEPIEIRWAGTGFLAAHRSVIEAMIKTMPVCILNGSLWFWPMFMPFVWQNEENQYSEYLSEDWAFCQRARELDFKVWLDPSVILTHLGQAEYTVYNMDGVSPVTDGSIE